MKTKGIFIFAVLVLISLLKVNATTISGTIYSPDFEELSDAILKINTTPMQQYIAKNSTYSFDVLPGEYELEAKYYEKNFLRYETVETIQIKETGSYVLDLLLFPPLKEESLYEADLNLSLSEEEIGIEGNNEKTNQNINYILILEIAFAIILGTLLYFLICKLRKIGKATIKIKENEKTVDESEKYYNLLVDTIKKEKRTTQKELRKLVPLSEAKVSLIITELEDKKLIRKVKKGRTNVIFWNE